MDYGDELIAAARERREMEEKMLDENGNALEKKDLKVNHIIDQLVNHEEKFTNQEIREHLMVLLITASETSANYVATTLVYLAIHQDIQQKVYDEICEVFTDDSVEVNWDTVGSLKYLEMVLKGETRLPGREHDLIFFISNQKYFDSFRPFRFRFVKRSRMDLTLALASRLKRELKFSSSITCFTEGVIFGATTPTSSTRKDSRPKTLQSVILIASCHSER